MIKFIHCADIHLDPVFSYLDDENKIKTLKYELKKSFEGVFSYALKESINVILISGDLVNGENTSLETLNYLNDLFRKYNNIDIVFIYGNHDAHSALIKNYIFNDNFHILDENEESCFEKENIRIYNRLNNLQLDKTFFNILMWHGDISSSTLKDGYNSLPLSIVNGYNFDYVALGHVHTNTIVSNSFKTKIMYSGCLMGQGFDECGEKGFLVISKEKDAEITTKLICNNTYQFEYISLDVTDLNQFAIEEKIANLLKENILYKVELTGKSSFFIDLFSLKRYLSDKCFFIKIKDKTNVINEELIKNTLKERYVTLLDKKIEEAKDEKEKDRLIIVKKIGLMAFAGEVKIYED